jgi:ribokinase
METEAAGTLVVVGSSNTDLVVRVREIPRAGEMVLGGDVARVAGGKGANQAVAAARLGARVVFVGCVGDDSFGEEARATLAGEGLLLDHLRVVAGVASGMALIAVAESGENSIVVAPGANAQVSVEDVELARAAIGAARMVVAQLEVPLAAVTHAFALARAAGVVTLLNPAPAPAQPLPAALMGLVDILVCNETEAEALTGLSVRDAAQAERAASTLLERGPRLVVLTRGGDGYLVRDAHGSTQTPAFRVGAVDTTAAGDGFIGAFAYRMAQGDTPAVAARYASAAAAVSVQRVGAQPSLPTAEEVASFLAEQAVGEG